MPHRLPAAARFPARPTRAAAPPSVPFLRGVEASIERIERQVARARRDHAPLALLALALGPVSAADGTPAPLQAPALALEFTRRLRTRVRTSDDLWQCADDEWIALLPQCRPDGARAAARRLAAALSGPYALDGGLALTHARVGSASLREQSDTATGLLATAQAALDFEEARRLQRAAG